MAICSFTCKERHSETTLLALPRDQRANATWARAEMLQESSSMLLEHLLGQRAHSDMRVIERNYRLIWMTRMKQKSRVQQNKRLFRGNWDEDWIK